MRLWRRLWAACGPPATGRRAVRHRFQRTYGRQCLVPIKCAVVTLAGLCQGQHRLCRLRRQLRQQLDLRAPIVNNSAHVPGAPPSSKRLAQSKTHLHIPVGRGEHDARRGDCALAVAYERVATRIGGWLGRSNECPKRQQQKQGRAGGAASSQWLQLCHGAVAG